MDEKVKREESQLHRLRHSAAHVMAQAVLEKFPEGKIGIGPPIESGFYYDFDLPRSLTPEDLDEHLGGTPERKRHSLELAVEALKRALESSKV